jgi:hypothetical protein
MTVMPALARLAPDDVKMVQRKLDDHRPAGSDSHPGYLSAAEVVTSPCGSGRLSGNLESILEEGPCRSKMQIIVSERKRFLNTTKI